MERRLAAILCAAVYGYSRLMREDEEATLRTLTSYRQLIDSAIEQHRGRVVIGDGFPELASDDLVRLRKSVETETVPRW